MGSVPDKARPHSRRFRSGAVGRPGSVVAAASPSRPGTRRPSLAGGRGGRALDSRASASSATRGRWHDSLALPVPGAGGSHGTGGGRRVALPWLRTRGEAHRAAAFPRYLPPAPVARPSIPRPPRPQRRPSARRTSAAARRSTPPGRRARSPRRAARILGRVHRDRLEGMRAHHRRTRACGPPASLADPGAHAASRLRDRVSGLGGPGVARCIGASSLGDAGGRGAVRAPGSAAPRRLGHRRRARPVAGQGAGRGPQHGPALAKARHVHGSGVSGGVGGGAARVASGGTCAGDSIDVREGKGYRTAASSGAVPGFTRDEIVRARTERPWPEPAWRAAEGVARAMIARECTGAGGRSACARRRCPGPGADGGGLRVCERGGPSGPRARGDPVAPGLRPRRAPRPAGRSAGPHPEWRRSRSPAASACSSGARRMASR